MLETCHLESIISIIPPESQRLSALEKYFVLEQSFWKQNEYRLGPSSQFRLVFEQLIPKVRSDSFVFNEHQYWQKLSMAEQVFDHVVAALRAYWIDAPADKIWSPVDPHLAVSTKPDRWTEASPVDAASLHEAAAQYLEEPWMQLNIIDWYVINGFIYDALLRTSVLIITDKTSASSGRENILPGANTYNAVSKKPSRALRTSIVSFILIPGVIVSLYYFGHETLAKWALLPYSVYMAFYLLLLPEKLSKIRRTRQDSCDLVQKQNRLSQLYQLVSAPTFNPSRIKEQIIEDERCGMQFDPVIHVIVDHAIQRDAACFKI
jgi:hypothetical protein